MRKFVPIPRTVYFGTHLELCICPRESIFQESESIKLGIKSSLDVQKLNHDIDNIWS